MPTWRYDDRQYSKEDFVLIPEGEYRVKIVEARSKQSSTMKDMIALKLKVEGQPAHVFYNLVFDPGKPGMTNQNLGRILDSFRLPQPEGDSIPFRDWEGAYGAARIKHQEYKGNLQATVGSFLTQEKQAELGLKPITREYIPAQEPEFMSLGDPENDAEDVDLPF